MTEAAHDVRRVVTAGLPEPVLALGAFGVSSPLQPGRLLGAVATLASLILRRRRLRLTGTGYLAVTETRVYLCDVQFAPTRLHRVAQEWKRDRVVAVANKPFDLRISTGGQTMELVALNYDDAAQEVNPASHRRLGLSERIGDAARSARGAMRFRHS